VLLKELARALLSAIGQRLPGAERRSSDRPRSQPGVQIRGPGHSRIVIVQVSGSVLLVLAVILLLLLLGRLV
jgi:hypothetical protein